MRLTVAIVLLWSVRAMATETPRYTVVEKAEGLELRDYEGYVVAETELTGTLESAGNDAFGVLAGYIFGNNAGRTKVAMTAPVTQQRGERIAMTAPVTQERSGDSWTVQFMMPSAYTLESLPAPTDSRVRLKEVPARRFAVIRYSGTWSAANYTTHLEKLRAAMRARGLEARGEPVWARYDAPITPWFLRRNEILIPVERPAHPG